MARRVLPLAAAAQALRAAAAGIAAPDAGPVANPPQVQILSRGEAVDRQANLVPGKITVFLYHCPGDRASDGLREFLKESVAGGAVFVREVHVDNTAGPVAGEYDVGFLPCVLVFDHHGKRVEHATSSPLGIQQIVQEAKYRLFGRPKPKPQPAKKKAPAPPAKLVTTPPGPPQSVPRPSTPNRNALKKAPVVRPASASGKLYAAATGDFEIYVNTSKVASGRKGKLQRRPVTFRTGDKIKVKCDGAPDPVNGFALLFASNDKSVRFSSKPGQWQVYEPNDENRWWDVAMKGAQVLGSARPGVTRDICQEVEMAGGCDCDQAVWGPKNERTVYLIKTVSYEDLTDGR